MPVGRVTASAVPTAARVGTGLDRNGLLAGLAVAATAFAIGALRHWNHWSGGFDLGIFDQAVWQLAHGRDHISLVDRRVLADHFSPVLYLLAPLYRLTASPLWLLGAQALAIGSTVLPVRAFARDRDVCTALATGLLCASAPLLAAAVFDAHPSTMAVPFIAATILYATRDRPLPALAAALAVAVCRADLGLTIVAAAIVAGRRTRIPLAAVGLAVAALGVVGPAQFGATSGWAPHFGHLGSGPLDAVTHPWRVGRAVLSASFLRPLLTWVLAAGALVALRPRWLAALTLAGLPVLLSRWGATELPWFHYGAPAVPFAVFGTIEAVGRLGRLPDATAIRWRVVLVAGPVAMLVAASPLSPSAPSQWRLSVVLRPDPDRAQVVEALGRIRPHEVVSADNRLVAHLSHREGLHMYPLPFASVDGFFASGSEPELPDCPRELVDVVVAPASAAGQLEGYEVIERAGTYVVMRRTGEESNVRSPAWDSR